MNKWIRKILKPKWYELLLIGVVFLYVGLVTWPNFLFDYRYLHNSFQVHSDVEVSERALGNILSKSERLIKKSKFYDSKYIHDIYLVSSNVKYRLLAFTAGDGFGASYPLINNIFINQYDIERDEVRTNKTKHNLRSLSSVIAHEAIHSLVENDIGFFKFKFSLKKWIDEGYADYIANESSFSQKSGIQLLCNGSTDESSSFQYFLYRKAIEYLIQNDEIDERSLFEKKFDFKQTLSGLKQSTCSVK